MILRFATAVFAALLVWAPPVAGADAAALWETLKGGGQVILMRHALTTPGVGDPPGMRVDDCSTQRNLTDEGRRHARRIGEAVRARGISIDKVYASPMCRCMETARLVFDRVDDTAAVSNSFGRSESEMPRQVREMRTIAGDKRRGGGGNIVLVSHATTIQNVTGLAIAPGEMVIVTPKGDGQFELRGKLMAAAP